MIEDQEAVRPPAPLPVRTPRAALSAKREYWQWRRPGDGEEHPPPRLPARVEPEAPDAELEGGLEGLAELPGAELVATFDGRTGSCLGRRGEGRDGDRAEADALVGWARRAAVVSADRQEGVEDIIVTAETAHHLLRPVGAPDGGSAWIYLRLGRPQGNLAIARRELRRAVAGTPPGPTRALPAADPAPPAPVSAPTPRPAPSLPSATAPPRAPGPDVDPARIPAPRPSPAATVRPRAPAVAATVRLEPRRRADPGRPDGPGAPDGADDADDPGDPHPDEPPSDAGTPDAPWPDRPPRSRALTRCLTALRELVQGPDDDPQPTTPSTRSHDPRRSP